MNIEDMVTTTVSDELGDCYEVHANWTRWGNQLHIDGAVFPYVLVHGIVDPAGHDIGPHGHAWFEVDLLGLCFDFSRGQSLVLPKEIYYRLGRIGWTQRYTPNEVRNKLLEFGHYGPWEGPEAVPPLGYQPMTAQNGQRIVDLIDEFGDQCLEDEYTDTEDVWALLKIIREVALNSLSAEQEKT